MVAYYCMAWLGSGASHVENQIERLSLSRENHTADMQINDKTPQVKRTMDSQGDDGAEAPPAGTVDESASEEHAPTTGTDDESPSDCDSSDSDSSTSSGEGGEDDGETNDQNSRNMTPNCSALLCWLRTFPVLEDHLDANDDTMGCNFGDREVVA